MNTIRWICMGVVLGLVVLIAPGLSRGQDQAKAFYSQGVELFNQGQYVQAATSFRKAYQIKPSWKIYFNIGQSEAAAKRYGLAWEAFELYLIEGGDEIDAERRDYVLSEIQRMKVLVGFMEVRAPSGIEVLVDAEVRGTTPLKGPVRIEAGTHKVVLRKGIEALLEREISVIGGTSTVVEYTPSEEAPPPPVAAAAPPPEPKPAPPPAEEPKPEEQPEPPPAEEEPTPEAPDEGGFDFSLYGWIGVGVGGGLLVGGVVTGVMAISANNDLKDKCPDGQCGPDEQDQIDKRDTLGLVSTILVIGGGAIAAAGATLLIIDAVSGDGEETQVSLAPLPTGASLSVTF